MSEVFLFFVSSCIFIISWNVIWKKTVLDEARDRLFDLREKVKDYFMSNDIGLDNDLYKNLRSLINSHIRFTEDFTIKSMIIFYLSFRKKKYLMDEMNRKKESLFQTDNEELKKFCLFVREESIKIIVMNRFKGSLLWIFVIFIGFMVFLLDSIYKSSIAKKTFESLANKIFNNIPKNNIEDLSIGNNKLAI